MDEKKRPATRLVGEVLGDIRTEADSDRVLWELEHLMVRYRIDRIDIGWKAPPMEAP